MQICRAKLEFLDQSLFLQVPQSDRAEREGERKLGEEAVQREKIMIGEGRKKCNSLNLVFFFFLFFRCVSLVPWSGNAFFAFFFLGFAVWSPSYLNFFFPTMMKFRFSRRTREEKKMNNEFGNRLSEGQKACFVSSFSFRNTPIANKWE